MTTESTTSRPEYPPTPASTVHVKRARSELPPPFTRPRKPLFRRLKIPDNPNDPPEFSAEYLALLAVQAKPSDSSTKDDILEVPADFIVNLIEARWKAEKERCDAECKAQLLEVKNLPRTT